MSGGPGKKTEVSCLGAVPLATLDTRDSHRISQTPRRHAARAEPCESDSVSRYGVPMSEPERKAGRKKLGERFVVSSRPPVDDKTEWARQADELGLTLGSFVILTVNTAIGLDVPDFVLDELARAKAQRDHPKLEELPMQRAS